MARMSAIESTETWNKNLSVGDKLEGLYTKTEISNGQYGQSNKYIIETKDGKKYGVYGTASLDRQFNNIPEGVYVWIEYKGEQASKQGRPVKLFQVEYDPEITKL